MKRWPQHYTLYHKKYVIPCVNMAIKVIDLMTNIAALCVIVGAILEFGFELSDRLKDEFDLVYFWAWNMFLLERVCHLVLTRRGKRRAAYNFIGWTVNGLLTLTLIPIILNILGIDDSIGVISILENRAIYLLVLFLISSIELSSTVISSLGRKSNPSLMMAVSFLFIIMAGSGMLLMPRCIQQGVHLSWIDSLFTATSAVCVTGLTTIDVPSTFTSFGQLVIMMLIQVGGLGVMTITSFFALFFMGNTSIYNQMQVQDMVSSKSLASLWSTLLNIFGFTAVLELAGAVLIFLNIHGTIGLDIRHCLLQWRLLQLSGRGGGLCADGGALLAVHHSCPAYYFRWYRLSCAGQLEDGCDKIFEGAPSVRPEHKDRTAHHHDADRVRYGTPRLL